MVIEPCDNSQDIQDNQNFQEFEVSYHILNDPNLFLCVFGAIPSV